jgi:hypothetical protein
MAAGQAMSLRGLLCLGLICVSVTVVAHASGPRWITGAPYFYAPGYPVVWYTDSPQYFIDPGDLSPYVNHAAADAIVTAAAGVWTVPTSRLTLTYGGSLDEHIGSSNTYSSSTGIVFPADVQPSNYLTKQIAVIYDSDGSITDLLLGAGAGMPSGCRQNAVTESVDSFRADGHILHAVLVLNGRCTGPVPEQQLQMQYQLMRAFGRVLGLGWSQTNDNVFTGSPRPTYQQALYWPVMHPIDVICGPYIYQCMPNPFTLRDDDISGLDLLYPVGWSVPPGKAMTLARANQVQGRITFPNGQGMQGVNVVVHREEPFWDYPEEWESASAVTGYLFRRSNATPVSTHLATAPSSGMGSTDASLEGFFNIYRIPLYDWESWQNLVISTQPINPLYTGAYAVGPYEANAVQPSGSTNTQIATVVGPMGIVQYTNAIGDAAGACDPSSDGTESAPAQAPGSGWWTGSLCSYGHSAWSQFTVQPGRTFTLEVTAQDEHGLATTAKALPVIGIWSANDPAGSAPSIAAAPAAFNSAVSGMTTLSAQTGAGPQPYSLRMAIADQRGDGRPDYGYQARILYADSITPANLPSFGGAVTITGMGFRPGNTVTVNGVAATVSGWTANTITAVVPSLRASTALMADVTVRDLVSGATTTMIGALNYAAPQPALVLLSAPLGQVFTGSTADTPFAIQLWQSDGVTPISGATVTLSVTSGQARLDACGSSSCTLTTDAQGRVSSGVTPLASGFVTLSAAGSAGTVTTSFTAITRIQTLTALNPNLYVAAGAHVDWMPQVLLADNAASVVGVPVQWTANSGSVSVSPSATFADAGSIAQTAVGVGLLGINATASVTACGWAAVCAEFTVQSVAPDQWGLEVVSGSGQAVAAGATLAPVVLRVVDPGGHPVAGAPVDVHQVLEPRAASCPDTGRCPIAPVYSKASVTLVSSIDGTVTITPLDLAGQPVICNIAVATGTQGFVTLVLQRLP